MGKKAKITIDGITRSLKEWAEVSGISYNTLTTRRMAGWPDHRLLEPSIRDSQDIDGSRPCRRCNVVYKISVFESQRRGCSRKICPSCHALRYRIWRAKNRKRIRSTFSERYSAYRKAAVDRGYAFELTKQQFVTFWQQPCSYCGSKIETVGIDRVDNTKGYTMENSASCCQVCNRMKMELSLNDFKEHIRMICSHLKLQQE